MIHTHLRMKRGKHGLEPDGLVAHVVAVHDGMVLYHCAWPLGKGWSKIHKWKFTSLDRFNKLFKGIKK